MTKVDLLAQKKEFLASLRRQQVAKEVVDAMSADMERVLRNVQNLEKLEEIKLVAGDKTDIIALEQSVRALENKLGNIPITILEGLKKKILKGIREYISEQGLIGFKGKDGSLNDQFKAIYEGFKQLEAAGILTFAGSTRKWIDHIDLTKQDKNE